MAEEHDTVRGLVLAGAHQLRYTRVTAGTSLLSAAIMEKKHVRVHRACASACMRA